VPSAHLITQPSVLLLTMWQTTLAGTPNLEDGGRFRLGSSQPPEAHATAEPGSCSHIRSWDRQIMLLLVFAAATAHSTEPAGEPKTIEKSAP